MRLGRIIAIAHKEFIHVLRDPRSLGMAVAIPMLLLVLFGYALTLDVDKVPVVFWDQSHSVDSREFISRFVASPYFTVKESVDNYADLEHAIDTGDVLMAAVIPSDFPRQSHSSKQALVQLVLDGSDSNTATIALGYAEGVVQAYSREINTIKYQRLGGRTVTSPVDFRPRVWFNPDLESKNYIIPGLIAVIMMVIAALLTSLTVAREWERGTMEQLVSTPVKGPELILGKFLPYFIIGMVDVLLAVLMGEFLFQVPLRGSPALLFSIAAVFLGGALSLGLLISIITKSQLLASQLAMVLTFLPSFLLSGFMYAISNMPKAIQLITHLVPASYFVTILKGIYLKGIGLEILIYEASLLTIFGGAMLLISIFKFKKKLA